MASLASARTVLLVEDEPEIRRFVARILVAQGCQVLEAQDGGHALAMCREHPDPIHLLITDVVIPDTNGPELAAFIQSLRPQVRVLYMSAFDMDQLVQGFGLNRSGALLRKPFSAEALLQKVRDLLEAQG